MKKCSENMQQISRKTPMPAEVRLQKSCKATLLKSHFSIVVLLQICCIFSEHLFVRTPLTAASDLPYFYQSSLIVLSNLY